MYEQGNGAAGLTSSVAGMSPKLGTENNEQNVISPSWEKRIKFKVRLSELRFHWYFHISFS